MRYHQFTFRVCIGLTLLMLCCATLFSVLSDLASAVGTYAAAVLFGAIGAISQFRADNQQPEPVPTPSHSHSSRDSLHSI